ncbi:uncharacterized protein SCHCODRAFT_01161886 [Schizophyllum commune H4-8]|uniref:Uncharacterized protein n=1 Tax=Schizophyllum commune (strain H4-8 / FGSC 9210) TaxID=578458 RepID=D8QJ20_SCHCM|nr:uncharacterized protein SCHCODRAFT_01161886 [Schizophyllum commune H4-8]KAI5885789.1 hypothetical protein SCHCODRAFT_01161886 [Schizophyllum commune H4-8]
MDDVASDALSTTGRAPEGEMARDDAAIVEIWRTAVERYERDSGTALAEQLDGSLDASSSSSIATFIEERAARFAQFRAEGHERARKWLKPIAAAVQLLSNCFGDAVTLPFSPLKAVFGAIDVAIKLSIEVTKDYDAAMDAFETIADHLARIKIVGANETLREPSVRVLSQTLVVLGIIAQLQRDGRFKAWIHKFKQSHELTEALADLQRLATNHHETLSAVTLLSVEKTMDVLAHSMTSIQQEQDMTRTCLMRIAKVAQDMHETIIALASTNEQQIHDNRGTLEDIQRVLLAYSDALQQDREDGEVERIFDWLGFPDSSIKINNLLRDRARSSGSWFLDGEAFAKFKAGTTRVLWLHGKAGSGKSTMIAAADRDIQTLCNTTGSCLALCHVFDATNNAIARDLSVLLSSILCQLVHHEPETVAFLSRARKQHIRGRRQPSLDELNYYTNQLLDEYSSRVFITIDGLDETEDMKVLQFLRKLRERDDISILVSSRSELSARKELESLADDQVLMSTDAVTRDINILLDEAFAKDGSLSGIRNSRLARSALVSGADGNFRWVALQAQQLALVAAFPLKVVERLTSMPLDLRALYDEALAKIDERDRADVRRLLMWLLFSRQPLLKEELAEIMSFDYSRPVPVFSRRFRPTSADKVIALVGSTFLSIDANSGDVRFAHASVLEYLHALPSSSPFYNDECDAMRQFTAVCVSYLTSGGDPDDGWANPLQRGGRVPLYAHAAENWLSYAARVDFPAHPELAVAVARFMGSYAYDQARRKQNRFMAPLQPQFGFRLLQDGVQPLHAACELLSWNLVDLILRRLHSDPNKWLPGEYLPWVQNSSRSWKTRTPLMVAISCSRRATDDIHSVRQNRRSVVTGLIGAGEDVNAFVRGRTPLHYAVIEGDIEIAEMLLAAGANVNQKTYGRLRELPERGTPEYYAIRRIESWVLEVAKGHGDLWEVPESMLLFFLDAGCELRHVFEEDLCSPLHRAVRRGDIEMVKLLLKAGAFTHLEDDAGVTPLHEAAARGLDGVVDVLLAAGASWRLRQKRLSSSLRLEDANPTPPGSRMRAWGRGRSLSFPPIRGVHDRSQIRNVYTLRPFAASGFGRQVQSERLGTLKPNPDLNNWWEREVAAFEWEKIMQRFRVAFARGLPTGS